MNLFKKYSYFFFYEVSEKYTCIPFSAKCKKVQKIYTVGHICAWKVKFNIWRKINLLMAGLELSYHKEVSLLMT